MTSHRTQSLPLPTLRLVLLLAAGAPLWLAQLWLPQAWILAALYLIGLGGAALREFRLLPSHETLTVKRSLPPRFFLESQGAVVLTIVNPTARALLIGVVDSPPAGLEPAGEIPDGVIPPRRSAEVACPVRAVKRGDFRFEDLYVRVRLPGGLVSKQLRFAERDRIKIYPRLPGPAEYQLLAQIDERLNPARPPKLMRGAGMEWESLREYLPGEDLRNVDWKASAKRGGLICRNRGLEKGQQVAIMLDAGRLMAKRIGSHPRLEHAVNAAVMLAYACAKRGDPVSVAAFSNRIESFLPATKGHAALARVLEAVYRVEGREVESDYWEVVAKVISKLNKRNLVVMLTDVLDSWGSSGLVRNLIRAAKRHLVLCVVMSEPRVEGLAGSAPRSLDEAYLKAAACQLRLDRELALEAMRSRGILVLETEPARLSVQLVRRYLDIRRGGLQ